MWLFHFPGTPRTLKWDLRVTDHPALAAAARAGEVIPAFVIDDPVFDGDTAREDLRDISRGSWPSRPATRRRLSTREGTVTELDELFRTGWTRRQLVEFHSARKLLLLAHSPEQYRKLGKLVAGAAGMGSAEVEELYRTNYVAALSTSPSHGMNMNALQHTAAYFKKCPSDQIRREVLDVIGDFATGDATLEEARSVILFHARALDLGYLASQLFLHPSSE